MILIISEYLSIFDDMIFDGTSLLFVKTLSIVLPSFSHLLCGMLEVLGEIPFHSHLGDGWGPQIHKEWCMVAFVTEIDCICYTTRAVGYKGWSGTETVQISDCFADPCSLKHETIQNVSLLTVLAWNVSLSQSRIREVASAFTHPLGTRRHHGFREISHAELWVDSTSNETH